MLGDKGYDSQAVRRDIEQRGGEAVIPSLASRKIQHAVDKAVYHFGSAIAADLRNRRPTAIRRASSFVRSFACRAWTRSCGQT
jgi:hypothetical protein